MKILLIDNYDSFTYNLVQLIGRFNNDIIIKRNDGVTIEEISEIGPDKIMISPGPGRPEDAGISIKVIQHYGNTIPILGVCLGHQAIAQAFGAKIIHAPYLMHGKNSLVEHDGKTIYKNLSKQFLAGRYHSLIIDKKTLPSELIVSSTSEDGVIMGIRHTEYPLEGIQFHPESILTEEGDTLIRNWLEI